MSASPSFPPHKVPSLWGCASNSLSSLRPFLSDKQTTILNPLRVRRSPCHSQTLRGYQLSLSLTWIQNNIVLCVLSNTNKLLLICLHMYNCSMLALNTRRTKQTNHESPTCVMHTGNKSFYSLLNAELVAHP